MLNLLQSASDDQTAIGACVLVLGISAFFVFVSFHLGPAGQKLRNRARVDLDSQGSQSEAKPAQSRERAA